MARYNDYAQIPMGKNDIGAKTIGEYFEKLLLTLWDEQEDFSGKRPFGNSGWEYDVYASLISAGVVDESLDEDGYVVDVTYSAANDIVCEMIKQIFSRDADVVPKSEYDILKSLITCKEEEAYNKGYENDKADSAREIFEEIEQEIKLALESNYKVLPQLEFSNELYNRVQGKIDALRGIENFIAELKKKYT